MAKFFVIQGEFFLQFEGPDTANLFVPDETMVPVGSFADNKSCV